MDIEDATTTFSSRARASIAASRTTAAPIAFTEVYRSISYIDWPTPTAAARCTSRSTPSSALFTASRSRTSPSIRSISAAR
jgi:hypothetical protein